MSRSLLFWIISLVITLISAYYQRVTGPTYPIKGRLSLPAGEVAYRFERSYGGDGDAPVRLTIKNAQVTGTLQWKRLKTSDMWTSIEMRGDGEELAAELPHQPPAGKLEYFVLLHQGESHWTVPEEQPVVIRFKGEVPAGVLIPHILIMFTAMLFSTRTAFELFIPQANLKLLTYWTLALMTAGGMILGPIVQKYAFGEFWTGIPFGTDLTDNKTLIAFVAWLIAAIAIQASKKPGKWIVTAAVVTLLVFIIPHSLFGSELKYNNAVPSAELRHP